MYQEQKHSRSIDTRVNQNQGNQNAQIDFHLPVREIIVLMHKLKNELY